MVLDILTRRPGIDDLSRSVPPDSLGVLIVEREPGVSELYSVNRRDPGSRITVCRSERAALDYYRIHRGKIDVVILDHESGLDNATALAQRLRSDSFPGLIAMSCSAVKDIRPAERKLISSSGIDGIVDKVDTFLYPDTVDLSGIRM